MRGNFTPLLVKVLKCENTSFHYFFRKDSEYLKILHIQFQEVGAKRRYLKSEQTDKQTDKRTEKQTDKRTEKQTDKQTDKSTYRKHRPRGQML